MSEALPKSMLDELEAHVKKAKARYASANRIDLGGGNAWLAPGEEGVLRLAPAWDYRDSFVVKNGKREPNPSYKKKWAFKEATIHWIDSAEGQTFPVFCLAVHGKPGGKCPICDERVRLAERATTEKQQARVARIVQKQVYLFNALVVEGPETVNRFTDDGKPNFCVVTLTDTQFMLVVGIIRGSGQKQRGGYGNIFHPKEGYDLLFVRPKGAKRGERWSITACPGPTALYGKDEAEAFKGWEKLLIDLPKYIEKDTLTPEALREKYWGKKTRPEARDEDDDEPAPAEVGDEAEEEEEEEDAVTDDELVEEDESDDEEEEDEDEAEAVGASSEDEEEEEEEEDEDEAEADDDDDLPDFDEDDGEEEAEEEEEEETPPRRKAPAKRKQPAKKPVKKAPAKKKRR